MIPFDYRVRPELLLEELRDVWVTSSPDKDVGAFLEDCRRRPHTGLHMCILSLLEQFVPAYEAHGILGMYPMHLLGRRQWAQILPPHVRGGALLDIGAGQGFVTEHARELFSRIVVTETAPSMVRRLQDRGFEAHTIDLTISPNAFPEAPFEVVSILNVLDRCEQPLTLLTSALRFLSKDGCIIISDPLPIAQRVRGVPNAVTESIGGARDTWEESLSNFYQTTIAPLGLTPIYATRLPYIYKSSGAEPYVILDDFVLVCKK